MKVTNINQWTSKTHTTLSADVIFESGKGNTIYFRVENTYKDFVRADATPFLAALLIPAMRKKENLVIEGSVSPTLLQNTKKIMELVEGWDVGFKAISVKRKAKSVKFLNHLPLTLNPFVACFFTGGVDSFYTFLKLQKEITHFILIHGCDVPLNNREFFHEVLKSVKKVAKQTGVQVVVVETNMREVIEPHLEWEWELAGALSSVALFLGQGLRRIYIPSGLRYDQLSPYGTHPDLDPLFSTEKVQIIHDGCEYSRLEKVSRFIAHSPLALQNLRVCCQVMKGKYNCNECGKCLQTKMELLCANALDKAQTLDSTINLQLVQKHIYNTKLHYHMYAEDILQSLRDQGRETQLQKAIAMSLEKSKKLPLLRKVANVIAHIDKKYFQRGIYSYIFGFTEEQDRKLIYKLLLRLRLIS